MLRANIKNILALFIGLTLSFMLLEIFLRIYNPIPARIKGNKILLPANQVYTFKNETVPGLDPYITHSKNSLGFRGEEPPKNLQDKISIITVGGSTTECLYMNDGEDWPNLAGQKLKKNISNLWLNNAGLDGHSTFGHQILLNDYLVKLKPKFVLFLVGVNDIDRKDLYLFDSLSLHGYSRYKNYKMKLVEHSEVLSTVYNVYSKLRARKEGIGHHLFDVTKVDTLTFSQAQIDSFILDQQPYLKNYESRLKGLMKTCVQHGIKPVFMSQPMLFGDINDPLTGKYLGNLKFRDRNSLVQWKLLQLYNNTTKNACTENNIPFIDLSSKLAKSTLYFYDEVHYTKAGSQKIAEIVATELLPVLKNY